MNTLLDVDVCGVYSRCHAESTTAKTSTTESVTDVWVTANRCIPVQWRIPTAASWSCTTSRSFRSTRYSYSPWIVLARRRLLAVSARWDTLEKEVSLSSSLFAYEWMNAYIYSVSLFADVSLDRVEGLWQSFVLVACSSLECALRALFRILVLRNNVIVARYWTRIEIDFKRCLCRAALNRSGSFRGDNFMDHMYIHYMWSIRLLYRNSGGWDSLWKALW